MMYDGFDENREDEIRDGSEINGQEHENHTEPAAESYEYAGSSREPVQPDEQGGTEPVTDDVPPQPESAPEEERGYEYAKAEPVYQTAYTEPPVKKKKGGFAKKAVAAAALAVIFGVVAGVSYRATGYIGDRLLGNVGADLNDEEGIDNELVQTESETYVPQKVNTVTDVTEVATSAMPAIVAITNQSVQELSMFGFRTQEYSTESSGSGIIVGQNETELLIATNNHVVEGAKTLSVCFINDTAAEAQIKGTDAENDLAVIAVQLSDIEEETLAEISVAELGDSETIAVGEPAIAIGNALGYGQSVTSGIISAVDREVTVDGMTSSLIQTDAAINPGNSGGALLNMSGQVIGINAVKFASSEVEGMGYAIPISTAQPILDELMNKKTRELVDESKQAFLGVAGVSVTQEITETYGMPVGLYLQEVVDGSPAAEAGLKKGDIITKFDGTKISSQEQLKELMQYYEAGEDIEVTIQVSRDGEYVEETVIVTLTVRTEE